MTFLATEGEPDELMRRFRRCIKGLLMTPRALQWHVVQIPIDVTALTFEFRMLSGERES